jgi:two-component system sensor histidine kinase MprB
MQLQDSLDESLLDRAEKAAKYTALSEMTRRDVPSWMLGAADVRIIFITSERGVLTADDGPEIVLGRPELDVAAGREPDSVRTIAAAGNVEYRVATVPAGAGQALVLAQPLSSQHRSLAKLGTVMLVAGGLGVLAAALAGWAVAACAPYAASPARSSGSPSPRTWPPSRSRGTTRSPGSPPPSTRC